MRRTVLSIFFFCLCLAASAYEVSEKQAAKVAARFFSLPDTSSDISLVIEGTSVQTRSTAESSEPEFYVFNRKGGGYVIISGDNSVRPILGYSETGSMTDYSGLPDNVKYWLKSIGMSVEKAREMDFVPDASTMKEWDSVEMGRTKAGNPVVELNTVCWGQREPYNSLCPLVGGAASLTGCLPLALCEIMCFYGWPASASGTVPQYTDEKGNTYGNYSLGTVYNWAELKKLTNTTAALNASEAVRQNLAQLIVDVGMSVKATYGTDATSAFPTDINSGISVPFGYNRSARLELRSLYSNEEWESMVISEISKNRPLFYTGQDYTRGGHAYVFDGYDEQNYVHINFGWNGSENGYYWLGDQFYGSQNALFDFIPDETGTSVEIKGGLYLKTLKLSSNDKTAYSFLPSVTPQKGTSFNLTVASISNDEKGTCNGTVKIAHVSSDGTLIEDVSTANLTVSNLPPGYMFNPVSFPCKINKDINFGDRLVAYFRPSDSSEWTPVKTCRQGEAVPGYILAPYAFVNLKDSYSVGEFFDFQLKNNNFPYIWGEGNSYLYSEWYFYLDGELKAEFRGLAPRRYCLPSAGNWVVRVNVRDISSGALSYVLSAAFTVN